MALSILSDIKTIFRPVSKLTDVKLVNAENLVTNALKPEESLGFFTNTSTDTPLETAHRLLREHGTDLQTDELVTVVTQLTKLDEAKQAKRRVIIQIVLTAAILALVLFLLNKDSDASSKAAFGFMGTVVGFWLK